MLVDTSALYAFFDPRDVHHHPVEETIHELNERPVRLILTNHIRAEAHALILNRRGHFYADRFREHINAISGGSLVFASESDEDRVVALVRQYRDKDFSLVDAISFAVMERLGVTHAVTLDHNSRQYGFVVL